MKTRLVGVCLIFTAVSMAGEPVVVDVGAAQASLERLRLGNIGYQQDKMDPARVCAARRAALVAGQHPFATVLTCADSRVPPEAIFNQGLGDIFVVRTAGAVADEAVLGSIEYAAEHLHVPLVVVMGHTSCGAVKAAMETPAPDHVDAIHANLERILAAIRPSLKRAWATGDPWRSAVYASVDGNLAEVVHHSPVLAHLGADGKVMFVGAVYELETGKVNFTDALSFGRHVQVSTATTH